MANFRITVTVTLHTLLGGGFTSCEFFPESIVDGDHQTLLVISLDGFASGYRDWYHTPVLDSLVGIGVEADALIPVYPTKTFPNHYTQVTGWYPGQHGIVSNRMYDPVFEEYFSIGDASVREGKWYSGEPIWVTAKSHGLRAATMFWPGSDACIAGYRPDRYFVFNNQVSNQVRIRQVVEWLSDGQSRPHFISLYMESIDRAGHLAGPHSELVRNEVQKVDEALGVLFKEIKKQAIADKINVVIISDHGMAQLSRDKIIFLDDHLALDQVEVVNWSPILELIPKGDHPEELASCLMAANENWRVFTSTKSPADLLPVSHPRIPPVVALADLGWSITTKEFFTINPGAFKGGTHGYDPRNRSMKGIFIASGPAFRNEFKLGEVSSVDLYELWCVLLNIPASPNSGDPRVWESVLKY